MSTYVDIRATYVAQTFQPLVRNFYPYAKQQPIAITTKCAVVNKPLLSLASRFSTFTLANTACSEWEIISKSYLRLYLMC